MPRSLSLVLLGVLLFSPPVWAQGQIGLRDACRNWDASLVGGTAGPDFTISTTPVTVVARNAGLCGAMVVNLDAAQAIRCLRGPARSPLGQLAAEPRPFSLCYQEPDHGRHDR